MHMVIASSFKHLSSSIRKIVDTFGTQGTILSDGSRNKIKIFDLDGRSIAIKGFGVPNLINKIAYRYFRKSKAQRSFEYAVRLQEIGIGTPAPIAYMQDNNRLLFGRSFYVCEHLKTDLTYRDLIKNPAYPDHAVILREFTAFTYRLHEHQVEFLDHSPGNTLIVKNNDIYDFYLVDLNRMNFRTLDFGARMHNFARLTPKKEMVVVMATEYARLASYDTQTTIDAMWKATTQFQENFKRKKELKKKLKFWK